MAGGIQPNTVIEWLDSQKGQPLLSIDGYLFTNSGKGRTAGVRYWKCAALKTHDCLVSAKSDGANVTNLSGIQNAPDYRHVKRVTSLIVGRFTVATNVSSMLVC